MPTDAPPRTCPPFSDPRTRPCARSPNSPPDSHARPAATLDGVTVTGITLATADLRAGEAFVAIRGVNRHGAEFARAAAEKGAVAIVTDAEGADIAASAAVFRSSWSTIRAACSASCRPGCTAPGADDDLPLLFGTTGTNGKTSVSHLLEGILGQLGVVTGLSSTAERHIAGEVIVSRLTTPEASEMHALLALMRERGVEAVAVEVSAQALSAGTASTGSSSTSPPSPTSATTTSTTTPTWASTSRPSCPCSAPTAPGARSSRSTPPPGRDVVSARRGARRDRRHARDRRRSADAAAADWIVDDRRRAASRHRVHAHRAADGRSLTTVVPVIGPHMAANAGARDRDAARRRLRLGRHRRRARRDGGISAYLPGRTAAASRATAAPPSTSTSATPPTRSRRRSRRCAA